MAKKNKYYVVWEGRQKGIFTNWEECQEQIKGYDGAQYKSFDSAEEADRASRGNYWQYVSAKKNDTPVLKTNGRVGKPIDDSLVVDAACSGASGDMEYQGIYLKTKTKVFLQGPFNDGTNNIGEFLAIVHALALLKKKGSHIPIYSDSKTAISWVKKKRANTKLEVTPRNKPVFELLRRAELWLAENTYSNPILKWETEYWGENPADFGRK